MATSINDSTIFGETLTQIATTVDTATVVMTTSIITEIRLVVVLMLVLYAFIWGFLMIRGQIPGLATDAMARMSKVIFVVAMVMTTGVYASTVVPFLRGMPADLASLVSAGTQGLSLTDATGAQVDSSKPADIGNLLDKQFNRLYHVAQIFLDKAYANASWGIPDLKLMLASVLILVAGLIFLLIAAYLFMIANFALSVLVAIGPIFILMLLFDSTKQFFSSWLNQVVNYILIVMLAAAVIGLFTVILEGEIVKIINIGGLNNGVTLGDIFNLVVIYALADLVLFQVMPIASALAGGVALTGGSRAGALGGAAAGVVGGAVGAAAGIMGGVKAAKSIARPTPKSPVQNAGLSSSTKKETTIDRAKKVAKEIGAAGAGAVSGTTKGATKGYDLARGRPRWPR